MGLFRRKSREPVVHPDVVRRIHLPVDEHVVRARLAEYADISSGPTAPLGVVTADGWTTLVLTGRHHPWAFHNLVLWLVDAPGAEGLVAVAEPGDGQVGYWVRTDDHGDWLSGYDDRGGSLTIRVPDNAWSRGDDLAHPPATVTQALAGAGVPTSLHAATGDTSVDVPMEDPQHDLNPALEATAKSRKRLELGPDVYF